MGKIKKNKKNVMATLDLMEFMALSGRINLWYVQLAAFFFFHLNKCAFETLDILAV